MLFFKLSAFYFFYFAAVGVYVIFLPKVLHDIGYTPSQIGVILALAPLMRFATPFLFLKHIKLDQKLFKLTLIFSVLSAALFYATIEHYYLLILNNALLGVCLSLLLPYIEVIALKELKDRYGKSRLYGSIGFMIISLVLAQFLSSSYIALHYYLTTVFLTAVFAWMLLRYDTPDHQETGVENSDKFSLIKHWSFWLSLFLMQMSFGGFYNFFTIYESEYGISLEVISYLWSFGVICEIIMFYFQSPLLKNNLMTMIKFSIFVTIIRWYLLYAFPDNLTVTYISQGIHAFSFGLYHSAVILYLYSLYSNKKLAQQFMLGISYGLGAFAGALISGWLYGEYIFLYSSLFALLALMSLYIKTKQEA